VREDDLVRRYADELDEFILVGNGSAPLCAPPS
jgi:hypothetical protein